MKASRQMLPVWGVAAALWFSVIAYLSLTPKPPGTQAVENALALFPFAGVAIRGLQTTVHMVLFGVWAVLCALALLSAAPALPLPRALLAVMAMVLIAGGLIEVVQIRIPYRAPGLLDLMGNLLGAALFLWLAVRTRQRWLISVNGGQGMAVANDVESGM